VHDNDIGRVLFGQLDGLAAVARFTDDAKPRLPFEQQAESSAHHRVIVGKNDSKRLHPVFAHHYVLTTMSEVGRSAAHPSLSPATAQAAGAIPRKEERLRPPPTRREKRRLDVSPAPPCPAAPV